MICWQPAFAQDRTTGTSKSEADSLNLAGQLAIEFEGAAPSVGEALPDVTIFDAQGQPFNLNRLKGDYSVVVFGCLT
jgi:cytochrome oxidase Cu insertion factor (SCO1/SenC/PrrC family)